MEADTLMPWIRVTKQFDYWPTSRSVMNYKPGTYLVKQACADKGIKEGCARIIKRPMDRVRKDDSRRAEI